jgi:acetylglutamate kinase
MTNDSLPIKRTLKPQDLLLRLVDSLGHARDAEIYLKLFSNKDHFAIIAADEGVLREELDGVLYNLRVLMRLELYPVVLLLASPEVARQIGVAEALSKAKLSLHYSETELNELDRYAYIQESLKKKQVPVILLNPEKNLTNEMTKLAYELRAQKIIFLDRGGGLFDRQENAVVNLVNLRQEREALMAPGHLNAEDLLLLQRCDTIIANSGHKLFISIVNPINLLRELFTVKGAGTMVELGSVIHSYTHWDEVDKTRLRTLLEVSFGKNIRDDFFKEKISHFYIEEDYQGAALLKDFGEMSYLSKFSVGTEARGLGVGRDLWSHLLKVQDKLFWRSDPGKHIASWYAKQCDGMHKTSRWTVFWKGIEPAKIPKVIDWALKQPVDFDDY